MVKIKDLASSERPREKLILKGPQNLKAKSRSESSLRGSVAGSEEFL